MDIPFWAFCALLVALVYVSLRYFAAKMGAEGLIAYMLWHNYRMPTKEELDKAEIWILKRGWASKRIGEICLDDL